MKKKLIVHFGVHRTGSTKIQDALKNNREHLKKTGTLYPQLFGMDSHVSIPWQLLDGKISPEDLLEEIIHHDSEDIHTIILSSEDFCILKDLSFLHILQTRYEVSVVLYLREQLSWLESWYNQHIRWPWDQKFSSATPQFFLANSDDFFWIDYQKLLERLEAYIPQNHIYIQTVGSLGVRNTKADFFTHLQITETDTSAHQGDNSSITSVQVDILRRINLLPLDEKARWSIISSLFALEIPEDNGSKTIFNKRQAKKVLRKYRESNQHVAKRYLSRDRLFEKPDLQNRKPVFLKDRLIYEKYFPELIKKIAEKT